MTIQEFTQKFLKFHGKNMPEIRILSNWQHLYGASVILCDGVLEEVARIFEHDFYLIPVSH